MSVLVTIRPVDRFDEPYFAALQRDVFSGTEVASVELSRAIAEESTLALTGARPALAATQRLGAFAGDALIGWTYGWFEDAGTFHMSNSGVVVGHRRTGVYSRLVQAVVEHAAGRGATVIVSRHSVLNSPVLIAKLKLGFHVTGTVFSEQFGLQVQLARHVTASRQRLFNARVIPLR